MTTSYWDVVEPIWDQVSIHQSPEAFLAQFNELPQAVGDLYAAHWLVSEVKNGAFPQFFSNSTGVLAPEAVSALKRMGLTQTAEIVEAAMTLFGEEYPRERDSRSVMIDWVWKRELSEDESHNLDIMLELSEEFLDAIGTDSNIFNQVADAYADTYLQAL